VGQREAQNERFSQGSVWGSGSPPSHTLSKTSTSIRFPFFLLFPIWHSWLPYRQDSCMKVMHINCSSFKANYNSQWHIQLLLRLALLRTISSTTTLHLTTSETTRRQSNIVQLKKPIITPFLFPIPQDTIT
jgi:hypothetical protein